MDKFEVKCNLNGLEKTFNIRPIDTIRKMFQVSDQGNTFIGYITLDKNGDPVPKHPSDPIDDKEYACIAAEIKIYYGL